MYSLELKDINKIYSGGFQAVYDFNLKIEPEEFIVLVGPSGCGKSTVLRMISGLEEITDGELIREDKRLNDVAPADRNMAMVFQNYALYGNMSVYDNVGISLVLNKQDDDFVHDKVIETSDIVGLRPLLNRFPDQLSGGQRQRVALGRSIAKGVDILLMDEPLSNLDAKLRNETRKEIVELHDKLKSTIIYVTHDQVEAMTMADRIVIMNEGRIQQVGTTNEVYHEPENLFVASFMGSPPMNFVKGVIKENSFISENLTIPLTIDIINKLESYTNKEVILGIRPEAINTGYFNDKPNIFGFKSNIVLVEFLGQNQLVYFKIANCECIANLESKKNQFKSNETIDLWINLEDVHFFDIETTKRIR